MQRLARFYWIKDVLRDPDADLYVGYESKTKSYTRSKRVAVVKNNYGISGKSMCLGIYISESKQEVFNI